MKKAFHLEENGLPWEEPPYTQETDVYKNESDEEFDPPEKLHDYHFHMEDIRCLLDRMVMDIQHLEIELVRTRYKLSLYLKPPYDEYLRMEIFNSMGDRYQGDPVFDSYLYYCGFKEYEDAIDTPFHINRMQRLAKGYDDHPDMYP